MYSPLEVYMKELLRGFSCGACSLKDDNAKLESMAQVASILMGNGEYPKDSLIKTNPPRSYQGMASPTTSCLGPTGVEAALQGHDGTTDVVLENCGCDKALLESMKDKCLQLDEKRNKSQISLEQTMGQVRSKDDMTTVPHLQAEVGGQNMRSATQATARKLRRSSSLPIESGEIKSDDKKHSSFDGVESTRSITMKNEETSTTTSKKLRGVKVNWQDMNPSMNQSKRVYSNPRKLLDSTSEYAGSAPPSRPERKMSTEDDSQDPLTGVAQDIEDMSSEQLLPATGKSFEKGFPEYKQSLVSCLAQDFQTRPPSSSSDRSIIDSVNDLWSASKDLDQDMSSVSLLTMAKSGTGPLVRRTHHSNDNGRMDVDKGKEDA